MIVPGDAVLALSNSGETAELADLVAHSRRFGLPLVAITARAGIDAGPGGRRRADAAGGAPRPVRWAWRRPPRTTMQMALGDALAVALLTRRGFTAADFHQFHPGGRLGARLRRVRDLMHAGEAVPLAPPDTPMDRALLLMTEKRFGCLGVVDADGRLVGIVTDGDLRRAMGPGPAVAPGRRRHDRVAAHHRARRAGGRGAARDERARAPDHHAVRGRRRPAGPSASCTSTTCCGRGWHERQPAARPPGRPRRPGSQLRRGAAGRVAPAARRPGGLARRRLLITLTKWLLPLAALLLLAQHRAVAGDRPRHAISARIALPAHARRGRTARTLTDARYHGVDEHGRPYTRDRRDRAAGRTRTGST